MVSKLKKYLRQRRERKERKLREYMVTHLGHLPLEIIESYVKYIMTGIIEPPK